MRRDQEAPPDALATFTTREHLIRTFGDAEAQVRQAFTMIVDAEDRLSAAFALGQPHDRIRVMASDREYGDDFTNIDRCIERMRRQAWATIVDRLELRRALSIQRRAEMERALKEDPMPPITEETVRAFIAHHAASLPKMIEEAIVEVFEWLRPRGETRRAEYKTNQRNAREEIGERVILGYAVEPGWGPKCAWHVKYSGHGPGVSAHLTALENVFTSLDGAGQFSRASRSAIENAIGECGPDGKWSTPYFSGRCFRNGNMHLVFRRLDLLAEFNRRAGGRNLKTENAPR